MGRRRNRGKTEVSRRGFLATAACVSAASLVGSFAASETRARQEVAVETSENGYVELSGAALAGPVAEPTTLTVTSVLDDASLIRAETLDGRVALRRPADGSLPATVEMETVGGDGVVSDTVVVEAGNDDVHAELRRRVELEVEEKP